MCHFKCFWFLNGLVVLGLTNISKRCIHKFYLIMNKEHVFNKLFMRVIFARMLVHLTCKSIRQTNKYIHTFIKVSFKNRLLYGILKKKNGQEFHGAEIPNNLFIMWSV